MSTTIKFTLAGLLTFFVWLAGAVAAPCQEYTVITNWFPPIKTVKNGLISGIAGDTLITIMHRAELKFDPRATIIPYKEAYDRALSTPGAVLLSVAKTPDRAPLFKWVGPIYTSRACFFVPKTKNINIRSIEDVMPYTIGVVTGTVIIPKLLSLGVPKENLVFHATAAEMVKDLANGGCDVIAYPKSPTFYIMAENGISPRDYEPHYEFMVVDLFIALNKTADDAAVERLQQELDKLKTPGLDGMSEYDHIVQSYFTPGI